MKAIFAIIMISILVLVGCTTEPTEQVKEENPVQVPMPPVEYEIMTHKDDTIPQPETAPVEEFNENGEVIASYNSDPITLDEVKIHNKYYDCWFVINGNVFEATEFVDRYSSTFSIRESCGTDATDMFTSRFLNSDKINATEAWFFLDEFYIGPLN